MDKNIGPAGVFGGALVFCTMILDMIKARSGI